MTDESGKHRPGANYGIVGDVKARAVAVGPGARAVSNQTGSPIPRDDFDAALRELHDEISRLAISATGMNVLRADLEGLKELATQEKPAPERATSLLAGLVGKLKMVGVLVEGAKPLSGPIKAIAAMFGVPLPF
jgi:hypothetical protein